MSEVRPYDGSCKEEGLALISFKRIPLAARENGSRKTKADGEEQIRRLLQ